MAGLGLAVDDMQARQRNSRRGEFLEVGRDEPAGGDVDEQSEERLVVAQLGEADLEGIPRADLKPGEERSRGDAGATQRCGDELLLLGQEGVRPRTVRVIALDVARQRSVDQVADEGQLVTASELDLVALRLLGHVDRGDGENSIAARPERPLGMLQPKLGDRARLGERPGPGAESLGG